jgi:hypothetical protein
VFNEIGSQKQIAWRITAKKQLRGDHELRTAPHEFAVGLHEFVNVLAKITNRRIELEDPKYHGAMLTENTRNSKRG